jgi:quercetin dioxygenase-like cupin family protein
MSKVNLLELARALAPWRSRVIGRPGGANLKVVRMDASAYPEEVHDFDEALLVLEGSMSLQLPDATIVVGAGEVVIVPAGQPHSVAPGSYGILLIMDA